MNRNTWISAVAFFAVLALFTAILVEALIWEAGHVPVTTAPVRHPGGAAVAA